MEIDFCDFVVWNSNDLFLERVLPNEELWDNVVPKAELFFRRCILPEVLGELFSKSSAIKPTNNMS